MTITAPPTTTPPPSSPPSPSPASAVDTQSESRTHILEIVLPVVLAPLFLISILILVFYRRRARTRHVQELDSASSGLPGYSNEKALTPVLKDGDSFKEMLGDHQARQEMGDVSVVYAQELGNGQRMSGRAELDGGYGGRAA
jgi:hypothetical protein